MSHIWIRVHQRQRCTGQSDFFLWKCPEASPSFFITTWLRIGVHSQKAGTHPGKSPYAESREHAACHPGSCEPDLNSLGKSSNREILGYPVIFSFHLSFFGRFLLNVKGWKDEIMRYLSTFQRVYFRSLFLTSEGIERRDGCVFNCVLTFVVHSVFFWDWFEGLQLVSHLLY